MMQLLSHLPSVISRQQSVELISDITDLDNNMLE